MQALQSALSLRYTPSKEMADTKLMEERVNLRVILAALIVGIASIALLYCSAQDSLWSGLETWRTLVQQIGSSLFTVAAIALLWELIAKRAFLEEMLAKTKIAKELLFSGVTQITDQFHEEVDWVGLFRDANKIDIFFAYGDSWRKRHDQKLKDFVARENARLRIVLPDPEEGGTMTELSRRFDITPDRLIQLVRDAEEFFVELRGVCAHGSTVEIWWCPVSPVVSWYRFDNRIVFALYSHRKERCPVPTLVCKNSGTLYEFFYREFQALTLEPNALARKRN